jgi:transposase
MATRPVDFRKGADGLAALVRETMGADPFSVSVVWASPFGATREG